MQSPFVRVIPLVAILALAAVASADSKAVAGAKAAIRQAVRNKMGASQRVTFVEAKEKIFSASEVIVSGNGFTSEGNNWRGGRSFTFSAKVKRDGKQTRDIHLTFGEGDDITDGSDWQNSNAGEDYVSLARPAWYQRFNSNNVTFEGESRGEVSIIVFDQDNRKVAEKKVKPNNGRFRTSLDLPTGLFRAVIQPTLSFDWDEVRFSVRSNSGDWGLGPGTKPTPGVESLLEVDSPSNNANLDGPKVSFSGTSKERDVKLEVYDSNNKRVMNQSVAVRNGRWSTSANFTDGAYKLIVQTSSGKDKDQRNFRVSSRGVPTPGVESILEIDSPKDGGKTAKRFTIAGRCKEDSVIVQLFDPMNKMVKNQRVAVKNGTWNLTVALNGGSHRLVVESSSGKDTDAIRFTVR